MPYQRSISVQKNYISQLYFDFTLNILKLKCLKPGTFIKGMFDPLLVEIL